MAAGVVTISADKLQKLGVKTELVAMRELKKTVRAVGRIEIDEQRTFTISPKFDGWVERLFVNSKGQAISKGQPLFEVYSPDLISAQRELALAKQGAAALKNADQEAQKSMQRLVDASTARLKNWAIADTQINQERLTFHSPVSGVVLEKKAVQGMRFQAGDVLYQLADLSSVWVMAEVNESEIATLKLGGIARVMLEAYPDKTFSGRVDFIYPTLTAASRTVPVRIVLANPKGLLKPAMFAQVELPLESNGKALLLPSSAVIDSGVRQVVLVQIDNGRFEPRLVQLGLRTEHEVEVLSGLTEGERVVTSANFLIDAESNLQAALRGLSGHEMTTPARAPEMLSHEKTQQQVVPKKSASIAHIAHGVLENINADNSVSITHQPIKSLGWPGMTMDFVLANASLLKNIAVGDEIDFEIVERKPDDWVVIKIQPSSGKGAH